MFITILDSITGEFFWVHILFLFFDYVKSEIYVFITMEIHGVGLDWVRVKAMSYSVSYMLQMILAIMKFLVYMFGLFLFLSFFLSLSLVT